VIGQIVLWLFMIVTVGWMVGILIALLLDTIGSEYRRR
jgi:hypothetical protein